MATQQLTVRFDGRVPATLRKVAITHASVVQEVTGKGVLDEGYDVSYRTGWCSGGDPMGAVHADCANTVKELARRIRDARRCDCADCIAEVSE